MSALIWSIRFIFGKNLYLLNVLSYCVIVVIYYIPLLTNIHLYFLGLVFVFGYLCFHCYMQMFVYLLPHCHLLCDASIGALSRMLPCCIIFSCVREKDKL